MALLKVFGLAVVANARSTIKLSLDVFAIYNTESQNQLSHLATPPSHFKFVVPKSGLDIADCEVQV